MDEKSINKGNKYTETFVEKYGEKNTIIIANNRRIAISTRNDHLKIDNITTHH